MPEHDDLGYRKTPIQALPPTRWAVGMTLIGILLWLWRSPSFAGRLGPLK
jgi:hypothetical protein